MQGNKGLKILIYGAVGIAAALVARRLIPVFLPFALGGALAYGAEGAVTLLTSKLRLPRWAASGLGVSGFFVFMASLLLLSVSVLVRQLGRLSGLLPRLAAAIGSGLAALEHWLLGLAGQLPQSLAQPTREYVTGLFSDSSAIVQQAAGQMPQIASGLFSKLGHWGLVLFTAVLSGYMISARLPALRDWCRKKLPHIWQEKYLPAWKGLRNAAGGWLLAQGKLMGLTFLLLIAGFLLLRIKNAPAIAALVALVDAFPVLGTGTILLPWSLVCLLQDDQARGIGLLGLYAVVWLVRSVLEPRILGKELGLDPLTTLFSVYAGFQLLGIGGMFLAPFAAMLVTQLLKQSRPG